MVPTQTTPQTNKTSKTGEMAWIGLIAYIIIYDIIAMKTKNPTLSIAFYKLSQSKIGQPVLITFWFYLTAHLFRWIPRRYDLFRAWGDSVRKKRTLTKTTPPPIIETCSSTRRSLKN